MPVKYHYGKFPPGKIKWEKLVPLIGRAHHALGQYDALLSAAPNVDVLLSPLMAQEAVLSSKIEGTFVTMGELLEKEAGAESVQTSPEKEADLEEVLNYRRALSACSIEFERRPFSQQILRMAHEILMQGVRGHGMSPGNYRKEQNWVGSLGTLSPQIQFIPIAHEHLQSGMDQWEIYLHSQTHDPLVQLAIVHVEFESLHPFKDGNGRLGRMLIPLFLYQKGILQRPDFYMSGYLEAHRNEYQDRLRNVSRKNEWTEWCAFFLQGIIAQASANKRQATEILGLFDRLIKLIPEVTHSYSSNAVLECLFKRPIFTSPMLARESGVARHTVSRMVKILEQKEVLRLIHPPRGRRPAWYVFKELMNIAESEEVF